MDVCMDKINFFKQLSIIIIFIQPLVDDVYYSEPELVLKPTHREAHSQPMVDYVCYSGPELVSDTLIQPTHSGEKRTQFPITKHPTVPSPGIIKYTHFKNEQ